MPATRPQILKVVVFKIGPEGTEVEYACDVSDVTLTADTPIDKWDTLCEDGTGQSPGKTNWALNVTYYQGYGEGNLSRMLLENVNEIASFEFTVPGEAAATESVTATGEVMLVPGTIGGTVNQFMTSTIALPVQGTPTFTFATP